MTKHDGQKALGRAATSARRVSAVAAKVQDVGAQMVSDFANSQVPGLGDALDLLGP